MEGGGGREKGGEERGRREEEGNRAVKEGGWDGIVKKRANLQNTI